MQHVRESKIIAIVRGQAPEKMFSLAKALLEGGIDMMEITFNQSDAQSWQGTAAAIRSIHDGLPEMYIGAGTVLTTLQLAIAREAGAQFIFPFAEADESMGLLNRGGHIWATSGTERGAQQTYDYQGDCVEIDAFNPETRKYIWEVCKKNYYDLGIDGFWLDNSEPDSTTYDFENYRYYTGRGSKVGCEYPKKYVEAFYNGQEAEGDHEAVNLCRSAWVGSQKYRTLVWTGDVQSNFESFKDQVIAGQNMGLAGIPWWTTDIGGFMTDNWDDPDFRELLIRWYQYGVFCPILRMHGNRGPDWDIPKLDDRDFGGGYLYTGHPNELWSYGEEAYEIMKKWLDIRLSMKDYIAGLMEETAKTGAPIIRTMFFEFPDDEKCWDLPEQYMFGSDYLVAPVLELGARERSVYLPKGQWESISDKKIYSGGQTVTVPAPLDVMPVFKKIG